MATNILKKRIDCIAENFLDEVFGKMAKPMRRALRYLFSGIVARKATLVTDMAKALRRDSSSGEAKRTEELVSGWLGRWDFVSSLNPWLLKGAEGLAHGDPTFAIDFSDISKEFGGAGMEGMSMGWDGSRGVQAMGHDFLCVSHVGADCREALPVYASLAKGRRSKGSMLDTAINAVMERTGGRGWMVEDRGMDTASHIVHIKHCNWHAAIRVKEMGRDVFGDGLPIEKSMADIPFSKTRLRRRKGDRIAQIRWKEGVVRFCEKPNRKDAPTEDARVLVIESRLDEHSIWIYAICKDGELDVPENHAVLATRAAQAYCDRWQIEESFKTVKQEFALEKVRVRTFARLSNIFALCVLAYVFVTRRIRQSEGFKSILKCLSDNLAAVSEKTHALLTGIRALIDAEQLRNISGRPRKSRWQDPLQPTLPL